jgi:O-antigen ligase
MKVVVQATARVPLRVRRVRRVRVVRTQHRLRGTREVAHALLVILVVAAGFGPLLRLGEVTVARAASMCLLLCLLPFVLRRCTLQNSLKFVPSLFGLVYGSCLLYRVDNIVGRETFIVFLSFGYGMVATSVSMLPMSAKHVRQVFFALNIVGLIAAFSAILEYHTGVSWYTGEHIINQHGVLRARGLHGVPSTTAMFIFLSLIPAQFLLVERNTSLRIRLLAMAVIAIDFYALYCTASRGAFIAIFLVICVIVLSKRVSVAQKLAIVLLMLIAVVHMQVILRGRELSYAADNAGYVRMLQFRTGIDNFRANPVIGYGSKSNPFHLGGHNNFLEVLAYGGLVSFVPFLYMHWRILRNFWKRRSSRMYTVLFALFLSQVGLGLVSDTFTNVIFWGISGLCLNDSSWVYAE